jgi:tetratricopeptide (TPR) repeat protein
MNGHIRIGLCFIFGAVSAVMMMLSTAIAGPIEGDPAMQSNYGRELLKRGEFEAGIEYLRKAYQLFPLNAGFKRNLAEGYAAYGRQHVMQKRYEQADESFVNALELYPEDAGYALMRGICNYYLKKYDIARYELQRAKTLKENSVDTLYYLGLVEFDSDHQQEAIELWEQALKLSPGRAEIVALLAKSRKEHDVEAGMDRGHSSRFDLTFDPGVDASFAQEILDVLESAANLVGAELQLFPEARVPVGIYKRSDYKSVTDSPDWSGGFYDGKIRLPFGALKELTPGMRGILYHEYAHVVVYELTRGNCPLWLNEGIAEMFGRKQYDRQLPTIGKATRAAALFDMKQLETSFAGLSPAAAAQAYQQSYSLVNYMVSTYGWHRVRQILAGLGTGLSFDASATVALKDFNLNYDVLLKEWRTSVEKELTGN